MKRIAIVLALLALPAIALAADSATMSLRLASGGTSVTVASSGGTFHATIVLDDYTVASGMGIANVNGYLQASANGVFVGTGRTWGGPFNTTNGDTAGATTMNRKMDPLSYNWGIAATGSTGHGPPDNNDPPGINYIAPQDDTGGGNDGALPWTIETITIGVNTGTPGTYNLIMYQAYAGTSDMDGIAIALDTTILTGIQAVISGGQAVITITPEPATMLLLAAALPFLRRRRA